MGVAKDDRITFEELRYLSIFEDLTGAMAYRCITDDNNNRLIFLVKPSDMGKAIGRRGRNIRLLEKLFGKNVEILPYADDLETMVRNLFPGIRLLNINVVKRGDSKIIYVKVHEEDLGRAIGKGGRNSQRARLVLKKLFDIDSVVLR